MTDSTPSGNTPEIAPLIPPIGTPPVKKEKRAYPKREQLLVPLALVIGILFDRLIAVGFLQPDRVLLQLWAAFWLCYLVIFTAYHWQRLRGDLILWAIAGFTVLICLWNFFFDCPEYAGLTLVVIPAVLMTHAQIFAHRIQVKQVCRMILAFLGGFFIAPLSAIPHFFGATGSALRMEKKPLAKNIFLAVFLSGVLLAVIVPLLLKADMAFSYFFHAALGSFIPTELLGHGLVIFIATLLFFSFFWNSAQEGEAMAKRYENKAIQNFKMAPMVLGFVVSVLLVVYVLFCSVQFTYLFAQAGLPDGMTYATYAREGFSQMVTVCALNLLIFGFCLFSGQVSRWMQGLLSGLLGATAIILVSGFVRLQLYIAAYGMTWLRLLSAWFIFYLAAAIVLCALRLFYPKLPVVFTCGMLLLAWFTVLGYANPAALIAGF